MISPSTSLSPPQSSSTHQLQQRRSPGQLPLRPLPKHVRRVHIRLGRLARIRRPRGTVVLTLSRLQARQYQLPVHHLPSVRAGFHLACGLYQAITPEWESFSSITQCRIRTAHRLRFDSQNPNFSTPQITWSTYPSMNSKAKADRVHTIFHRHHWMR
jgi:hypothetical protein